MKKGKFRKRLLAFALPLTLIPFVVTALAVYYFVLRFYDLRLEDEQGKLLAKVIVDIRREQETARRDVALIANIPVIAEYLDTLSQTSASSGATLSRSKAAAHSTLQSFFAQNPYYLQLGLLDPQGNEQMKLSKLVEADSPAVKNDEIFRRMLIARNRDPQVQMPVEPVRSTQFSSMFTSCVQRETFSGVVVLHLNTDVFERHLRGLLTNHKLSTVLFDDRGLVFARAIAGANEEQCLSQVDLAAEASTLLAQRGPVASQREMSAGNRDYLFSIVPAEALISFLEPMPGEKWFLGVIKPTGIMREQMRTFQAVFFVILVVAIGAVIRAATRHSRRFTEPLEQMAEATTKIARGEFDIGLGIKTGDEVEELAVAVKQMADDLKKYETELIKSTQLAAIGEVASEVSHEIQNRISGLSLWIQYLDAEMDDDDPKREYLDEMKQGLQGFVILLADLKQVYRTPILNLSVADLNQLVFESLECVQEPIAERKIKLDVRLESDLPAIECDAEKIKSVIINLLVNALEAVYNAEGRITVDTAMYLNGDQISESRGLEKSGQKRSVRLSVSDNGIGIPEAELSRVFYPFYSTKATGSGLGLAIASNLIHAHGGKIEVESSPGEGTTFTVIFHPPSIASASQRP